MVQDQNFGLKTSLALTFQNAPVNLQHNNVLETGKFLLRDTASLPPPVSRTVGRCII